VELAQSLDNLLYSQNDLESPNGFINDRQREKTQFKREAFFWLYPTVFKFFGYIDNQKQTVFTMNFPHKFL
jgi:hypothetical protein